MIFDGFFLFQSLKHDGEVKEEKISSLQSQLTDLQMDSTTEVIFAFGECRGLIKAGI